MFPDVAPDLPAPRDDEPESLRQDIADELADHLQSALIRELHATRDERTAKQNVLDHFGNPTAVARKLWFDAMKEKIMSQRLTLATAIVAALASLASAGVVWVLVDHSRAATDALLEQSRTANEALLAKLATLTAPSPSGPSEPIRTLDWNPVKVKLVLDRKGGPPAVGYKVDLSGNVYGDVGAGVSAHRFEKTSDKAGEVDFGMVHNGRYSLTIYAAFHNPPWKGREGRWNPSGTTGFFRGETYDVGETLNRELDVRPGENVALEIVCPSGPPPVAPVEIAVAWPEELPKDRLWLLADFADTQTGRVLGGESWSASQSSALYVPGSGGFGGQDNSLYYGGTLIVSPAGKFVACTVPLDKVSLRDGELLAESFGGPQSLPLDSPGNLKLGQVKLVRLAAAVPITNAEGQSHLKRVGETFQFETALQNSSYPWGQKPEWRGVKILTEPVPQFETRAGVPNRWTIAIPDALAASVRSNL